LKDVSLSSTHIFFFSSARIRRHMEAVAAAEALLLGKRALRRRPKDLDSIALASSMVSSCFYKGFIALHQFQ
jgi:hypothetical protein